MSLIGIGNATKSATEYRIKRAKRRAKLRKNMDIAWQESLDRYHAIGENYKIHNIDTLDNDIYILGDLLNTEIMSEDNFNKEYITNFLSDLKKDFFNAYFLEKKEANVPASLTNELKGLEKLISTVKDEAWKATDDRSRAYLENMIPQIRQRYFNKIKGDAYQH